MFSQKLEADQLKMLQSALQTLQCDQCPFESNDIGDCNKECHQLTKTITHLNSEELKLITKAPATMYIAIRYYDAVKNDIHLTDDDVSHWEYIQEFIEEQGYTDLAVFEKENDASNKHYLEYFEITPEIKINCTMPEDIDMYNVEFYLNNVPDHDLSYIISNPLTEEIHNELKAALAKIKEDPEFPLSRVENKIQAIFKKHGYTIFPCGHEIVYY
jgi:hypothetical protein